MMLKDANHEMAPSAPSRCCPPPIVVQPHLSEAMRPECLDGSLQEPVSGHSLGFDGSEWARGVTWEDKKFQFVNQFFQAFGILHLIFFPCVQLHTHFHHPSPFFSYFLFCPPPCHSLPYGYLHTCFHHPHQFFPWTQEPWGQAAGLSRLHHYSS